MVAVGSYMSYGSSFVDELYSESTIAVRWLVKDEPACHLHFLHSGKSPPKKTYFLGQHPKQGTPPIRLLYVLVLICSTGGPCHGQGSTRN